MKIINQEKLIEKSVLRKKIDKKINEVAFLMDILRRIMSDGDELLDFFFYKNITCLHFSFLSWLYADARQYWKTVLIMDVSLKNVYPHKNPFDFSKNLLSLMKVKNYFFNQMLNFKGVIFSSNWWYIRHCNLKKKIVFHHRCSIIC